MPANVGYLTADRGKESDETYTLPYAVEPIIKYIKENDVIWCPFDEADSAYVQEFEKHGYKVIHSHISEGKDFFEWEPDEYYDIIISNPPYSNKDDVLKRLKELDKPFAMLLPLPTLQGQKRFEYLQDTQALIFDKRIKYIQHGKVNNRPSFASIYICKNVLPRDLIFEQVIEN